MIVRSVSDTGSDMCCWHDCLKTFFASDLATYRVTSSLRTSYPKSTHCRAFCSVGMKKWPTLRYLYPHLIVAFTTTIDNLYIHVMDMPYANSIGPLHFLHQWQNTGQVATELHRWALPNDADAGLEDAVRELRPQPMAFPQSFAIGNGSW